jgi:hypothetical protein
MSKEGIHQFASGLDAHKLITIQDSILGGGTENEVLQNPQELYKLDQTIKFLETGILSFERVISLFLDPEEEKLFKDSFSKMTDDQKVQLLKDVIFMLRSEAYSKDEGNAAKEKRSKTKQRAGTAITTLLGVGAVTLGMEAWENHPVTDWVNFVLQNKKTIALHIAVPFLILGGAILRIRQLNKDFEKIRRPYADGTAESTVLRLVRRVNDQDLIEKESKAYIALVNTYLKLSVKYPNILKTTQNRAKEYSKE